MICLPTRVDPVKTILATPGCSTRASPATPPVAGQHLEEVLGEPGLQGEFGEPQRGERGRLGGLEEDGVAGGERGGGAPGGDRHGEVPGGDHADDAERFEEGDVEAARRRGSGGR